MTQGACIRATQSRVSDEGWLSAMAGDGVEAVASQGSHLVERRTVAPGGWDERPLRVEPTTLVLLPWHQLEPGTRNVLVLISATPSRVGSDAKLRVIHPCQNRRTSSQKISRRVSQSAPPSRLSLQGGSRCVACWLAWLVLERMSPLERAAFLLHEGACCQHQRLGGLRAARAGRLDRCDGLGAP